LDSPFRDDPQAGGTQAEASASPDAPAVSDAQRRFLSCRWRKPADNGVPDHCGHRDVLPMAGTTGFVADAWCPDCEYFKAKRTPRKREERDPRDERDDRPDIDRGWRW
jgi:hypothetical protein